MIQLKADVLFSYGFILDKNVQWANRENGIVSTEHREQMSVFIQDFAKQLEPHLKVSHQRTMLLHWQLANESELSYNVLCGILSELHRTIEIELSHDYFVHLNKEESYYATLVNPISESFYNRFPAINDELYDAAGCYAFDLDMACVFHTGRATERFARLLGNYLGLKIKIDGIEKPLEEGTSGQITDAIITKTGSRAWREGLGKTAQELIPFMEIANNLKLFKDAYRDPAFHSLKDYTHENALEVFNLARSIFRSAMLILPNNIIEN